MKETRGIPSAAGDTRRGTGHQPAHLRPVGRCSKLETPHEWTTGRVWDLCPTARARTKDIDAPPDRPPVVPPEAIDSCDPTEEKGETLQR